MKGFFKILAANLLTHLLIAIVLGVIFLLVLFIVPLFFIKPINSSSVLTVSLNKPISQYSGTTAPSLESVFAPPIGLSEIISSIDHAKNDKRIKGLFLDFEDSSQFNLGAASRTELRNVIGDFKAKGKFVIGYGELYTDNSYHLASIADQVLLNPHGELSFDGFSETYLFLTELLDKAGVEMEIFYAGEFKGATEPFRLKSLSDQNRQQITEYLNGLYQIYLKDISESREIKIRDLADISNQLQIRSAEDAKEKKLVDQLAYRDQALDLIREKLGIKESSSAIPSITLADYQLTTAPITENRRAEIAVVHMDGPITLGAAPTPITDQNYGRLFRQLRKQKGLKAIVIRINSPGGSALASENIWREIQLTRQQGITVVTSMSDMAASGGYYIASASEKIVAQPNTITGSIGVFAMIPKVRNLLEGKLGVTFDTVK
ncbi:MAG: signal peptide peptidase SppA, partial [Verrucomicrobiota bacterium]